MIKRKVYQILAATVAERKKCMSIRDIKGKDLWESKGNDIIVKYLPSGNGFDNGCSIDWVRSREDVLIIKTRFHHPEAEGCQSDARKKYRTPWTKHVIKVRPSLIHSVALSVAGLNRNGIKSYIADIFHADLSQEEIGEE